MTRRPSPEYWARHLRQPVRFRRRRRSCCCRIRAACCSKSDRAGRWRRWCGSRARGARAHGRHLAAASAATAGADSSTLLDSAGPAVGGRIAVDWTAFSAGEQRRRVALPTYPFERQRYWIDAPADAGALEDCSRCRRRTCRDWFYGRRGPGWRRAGRRRRSRSRWLLFVDDVGRRGARRRASRSTRLARSSSSQRGDGSRAPRGRFTIDPRNARATTAALLQALKRTVARPT